MAKKLNKNYYVVYVTIILEKMPKQYVVMYVTHGSISNLILFHLIDMMNCAMKKMMTLFIA